jgi:copper chaperone CopZ
MANITYEVKGMTCAHCSSAVTEEVSKLVGVTSVSIDVPAGLVTVVSEQALDQASVAAAVDEAGYELVAG